MASGRQALRFFRQSSITPRPLLRQGRASTTPRLFFRHRRASITPRPLLSRGRASITPRPLLRRGRASITPPLHHSITPSLPAFSFVKVGQASLHPRQHFFAFIAKIPAFIHFSRALIHLSPFLLFDRIILQSEI